jgi:hypothetical protein
MKNKLFQLSLLLLIASLSVLNLSSVQAAMLFCVLAVSVIYASFWYEERRLLSPIVFIVIAYVAAFPIPVLFPKVYPEITWGRLSESSIHDAMLWSLRAFCTFIMAFWWFRNSPKKAKRFLSEHSMQYTLYVTRSIGWFVLIAGMSYFVLYGMGLTFIEASIKTGLVADTFQQTLKHLIDLKYSFFLLCTLLYFRGLRDRQVFMLFIMLIAMDIIEIIAIGSKAAILKTLLAFLLVFMFLPFRYGFKQIAVGILSLTIIYSSFAVVTEYRAIMRYNSSHTGLNIFSFEVQANSFWESLLNTFAFKRKDLATTNIKAKYILGRFGGGMFSWASLLQFTGLESPYENAFESIFIPFYSIAPRALFPKKAVFFDSGRYAREYFGCQHGGISVSMIGSFYFAWGYFGIILGMGMLGGFLAYITNRAKSETFYSVHWIILLSIMVIMLMNAGVTFHSLVTNVLRTALFLWLIYLAYPLFRAKCMPSKPFRSLKSPEV